MADLKWDVPNTDEVELSPEELAEIDEAVRECENGRTYSVEEVRAMMHQWLAEFAAQKPR